MLAEGGTWNENGKKTKKQKTQVRSSTLITATIRRGRCGVRVTESAASCGERRAQWAVTHHGVALGSDAVHEVQHSHVQCLNRFWLEERERDGGPRE